MNQINQPRRAKFLFDGATHLANDPQQQRTTSLPNDQRKNIATRTIIQLKSPTNYQESYTKLTNQIVFLWEKVCQKITEIPSNCQVSWHLFFS